MHESRINNSEVDALGVMTISHGCFERCCSNKKTPPYHSNLSFVTLRNRRPTLLRASAYRTPSEASPRRRFAFFANTPLYWDTAAFIVDTFAQYTVPPPDPPSLQEEKQVTHTITQQEQHNTRHDKNNIPLHFHTPYNIGNGNIV